MIKIHHLIAALALTLPTMTAAVAQTAQAVPGLSAPLQGGGVKHIASQLDCPLTLGSFQYQNNRRVRENSQDISCDYKDEARDQILTYIIFEPLNNLSIMDVAGLFGRDISDNDPDLVSDTQASRECQAGVGQAMIKLETGDRKDFVAPCFVFSKEGFSTLVAVWERDGWNVMVRMSGGDTRITNATTAVFALSHQQSSQTNGGQTASPAQPDPQKDGVGKADVDKLCETSTNDPIPGKQFNGKLAATEVLIMQPGRYSYPNNGALLLFADKSYLVRLPDTRQGIYGTDGDDLLMAGGIVGGCHIEGLSEVFERNKLTFGDFELEAAF